MKYFYDFNLNIFIRDSTIVGNSTIHNPNMIVPEAIDDAIHADKTFIIDAEHERAIDCPDLIQCLIDTSDESPCDVQPINGLAGWAKLPRAEQIALQVGWVAPMPQF